MTQRDLYFISGSPPCWSIMLAMEVKGLAYNPQRLNNAKGDQKSPDFLKVNPRGQVPVLTDDGNTVCETLAVLAYLDSAYPEPALFGNKPLETAGIWQAICDCDANLRNLVGDISRPLFRGKVQEFADQIIEKAENVREELGLLETKLSSGPWLAGETQSAADIIVYPVIMQLLRAAARDDAAFLYLAIHPLSDNFPNVGLWCRRMEDLPGYEKAYPPHWK